MRELQSNIGNVTLDELPSTCPNCHRSMTPNPLFGYLNNFFEQFEVFMSCPDDRCKESFIAYYSISIGTKRCSYLHCTSKGTVKGQNFSDSIQEISENFITIFNQSYAAEQQNLKEICGVGYRKALEFLIKDYAIRNNPEKKDEIEKKLLGNCINEYVDDSRIKSVAKRAVWLGNDETHYVRKWEGKNLQDLKKLIDLTVHWIEMEVLTSSFEEDMPE
jgi:hypothetical protein